MKEFIKRIASSAGYEIRQMNLATGDPFPQQCMLLTGVSAPVIFDVGANVGSVTQEYRKLFPQARIYSFEPFPKVFEQLERTVCGDKNIFPCLLALGSAGGTAVLRVNASSATNSLLDTDDSAASSWGSGVVETSATLDVESATVDEFCRERRIENIDILKIDTQGTELEILKGAAGMLSAGRIRMIYNEMIVVPTYKGQSRPHDVMGFLDRLGYDLHGLYNLSRRKDGRLLQMDAIFVRSHP